MEKEGKASRVSSGAKYLKSGVYGGLDGIVTTFAVVAGVVGANLAASIILIMGFANLIGDGISMAIGDYLSTKSEGEYYKSKKESEVVEMLKNPKRKKEEIEKVLISKGFKKSDAKRISEIISKNKNFEADTILHDELGLVYENVHPEKNAVVTFFSFLIFGMIPLLIFVIAAVFNSNIPNQFFWASLLSGISMFTLGAVKSRVTKKSWVESGIQTLVVGGIAATAAYFVGEFLARLI